MNDFKDIIKEIKKYSKIVIARHVRVDPDAYASELALKYMIQSTFPKKEVYAVGTPSSRFKYMGVLDKVPENITDALIIVLDTPDKNRVDVENFETFNKSIKMDHHPYVETFCDIEYIDEKASSTCELIVDFALQTKLKMNKRSAELLFQGIVSDTNGFTVKNTSAKTFELVYKMIELTNLDISELYTELYMRPLSEIRLQGYIAQHLTVTENGLGYIKITDDIIKEFSVDSASPGNMINHFNYISEILTWAFISEDKKNNIIRITIRSRGPVINGVASNYNGGGHERASGARVETFEKVDRLLEELDQVCKTYRSDNSEDK